MERREILAVELFNSLELGTSLGPGSPFALSDMRAACSDLGVMIEWQAP
jgi:hypothetical protein